MCVRVDKKKGVQTSRSPEIWLIRHGDTDWSRAGRHTGRTDVRLSLDGRRQAGLLKHHLADRHFSLVLTSPLSRAAETCALAGFGNDAEVIDDLVEWDYGAYEGRTTADIRAQRPGWLLWTDGVPDGESAAEVGTRIDRVITTVRATNGDVAIFGHGHSLRVLAARWLGLAPEAGRLFALDTAAVGILGYEREIPVLVRWNQEVALGNVSVGHPKRTDLVDQASNDSFPASDPPPWRP